MNNFTRVKKGELCPVCKRYYDRNVSVDGVIVKEGRVLLILRNTGLEIGKWALIGGHMSWDETVEEGMLREVKEEIGVKVKIVNFLGIYSDPKRDPNNAQTIALAFQLDLLEDNFKLQKEEISDIKWFSFDNLPENIAFDHRKIIEDYLKKNEIQ